MLQLALLVILSAAAAADESVPPVVPTGILQGVVVDGTNQHAPLEGIDVVLRAKTAGALVPVAETKTDRYGKYSFREVPLDPAIIYLPGANRQGVHYPGQRIRLDANHRVQYVMIETYAGQTGPCPLIAKRHELEIEIEERALRIRERIVLSNPSQTTYLGQPMAGGSAVTFWLSLPRDFDRVTFDKEFFGRRFQIIEHQPVTDIPWLPGTQELGFTYHIPLTKNKGQFLRLLDVPTEEISVHVRSAKQEQVSCNLTSMQSEGSDLVFASNGKPLPSGFTIDLKIRELPFAWEQYARWGALAVLITMAIATYAVSQFRGRRPQGEPGQMRQAA